MYLKIIINFIKSYIGKDKESPNINSLKRQQHLKNFSYLSVRMILSMISFNRTYLPVFLLMFLLLGLFICDSITYASPLDSSHIIILLDQSGTFRDKMESLTSNDANQARKRLSNFLIEVLPNYLKEYHQIFDNNIFNKERDYVSFYLFGLPELNPDFEKNYLSSKNILFQENFDFSKLEDIPFKEYERGKGKIQNWTVVTAAIPMAIYKTGESYRQAKDMPAFSRTFIIRISDEILNKPGLDASEIRDLKKREKNIKGFDYLQDVFRYVNSNYVYGVYDSSIYLSTDLKNINDNEEAYFLDNDILPIKVLITEVNTINSFGFYPIFEEIPIVTLWRKHTGKYEETLRIILNSRFTEEYPTLIPLYYRYKLLGEGIEEPASDPISLKENNEIPLKGFNRERYPNRIEIEGSFRINDNIYDAQVVKVKKDIPINIEEILYIDPYKNEPITDDMMINHPEWSQQEVAEHYSKIWHWQSKIKDYWYAGIIVVIFFIILAILAIPSRPEIDIISPEITDTIRIDLNRPYKGQVTVGKCKVINKKKKKLLQSKRLNRSARLKELEIVVANGKAVYNNISLEGKSFFGFGYRCEKHISNKDVQHNEDLWIMANPESFIDLKNIEPRKEAYSLQIPMNVNWIQKGKERRSSKTFQLTMDIKPRVTQIACTTYIKSENNDDQFEFKKGQTVPLGYLILEDITRKSFKKPIDILFDLKLERIEPDREVYKDWLIKGVVVKEPDRLDEYISIKTDSDDSGLIHISGQISEDNLQIPLYLDFSKLNPPFSGGDSYRLLITTLRGDEHILFEDEKLPLFMIVPNREETRLALNLNFSWEKEKTRSIHTVSKSGVEIPRYEIDLSEEIGYINISEEHKVNIGYSIELFTLTLSNQATSGIGAVNINISGDKHSIHAPGIKYNNHGPNNLIEIEDTRNPPEDISLFNLERTFENDSDNYSENLVFYLKTGEIEFQPNVEESDVDVEFKIEYWIQKEADGPKKHEITLAIKFQLLKNPGPQQISVDFGTSAIAVAFGNSIDEVLDDPTFGPSQCLLHMQEELIKKGRNITVEEDPYFLSSIINIVQKENEKDYLISLPATREDIVKSPNNLVPYLKKYIAMNLIKILIENKEIHLDELLRKAYDRLMIGYVKALIEQKLPDFEKCQRLVITHPNSYLFHHIEFMKNNIQEQLGQFKFIDSISESDAVAFWYYMHSHNLIKNRDKHPHNETVMIYDIGAGTLDVSVRRINRYHKDNRVGKITSIDLLSMHTIAGAGNEVDYILANLMHNKLLNLEKELSSIGFRYTWPICGARPDNLGDYQEVYSTLMIYLKLELDNLKKQMTERYHKLDKDLIRFKKERFQIQLNPISGKVFIEYDDDLWANSDIKWREQIPDEYGISLIGAYKILFSGEEIQNALEPFFKTNVDEMLRIVLNTDEAPIEIDTIILSGRTAQLPGLKDRINKVLTAMYKDNKTIACPALDHRQMKEAVSLGALAWAMNSGERELFEKYPIFGVFGIAYLEDNIWKWKTFFRFDDKMESIRFKGEMLPYYKNEHILDAWFCDEIFFMQSYCNYPETFIRPDSEDLMGGGDIKELLTNGRYFKILARLNSKLIKQLITPTNPMIKMTMESKYRETHFGEPVMIIRVEGAKFDAGALQIEPDLMTSSWWPYNMLSRHIKA